MYVLDAVSTRPWLGTLDEVYPVQIAEYGPLTVEANVTFSIYYTVQNTSGTTAWQVWGRLYQGTDNTGPLLSSFTSPTVISPGAYYEAPDTIIQGGIGGSTNYYLEVGHIEGDTFQIQASAGPNGYINPSGTVTVEQGQNQTFGIFPNANYSIQDVLVDGYSVGAVSTYTFNNVQDDHTIYATFYYTGTTPEGACCVGTTCYPNQTAAECSALSGVYQGDNTTCVPNPCGGVTGCVDPFGEEGDIQCIDPGYQAQCTGGTWQYITPPAPCETECATGEVACINGYWNECVNGNWVPTTDRCYPAPPANWLLIGGMVAAASIVGLAFIVGSGRRRK